MRVPDWLKTAMLVIKKCPPRAIFFRSVKNRVICERFKYAKFHISFWESKGNNFFNFFLTRKQYFLVKVQFSRTPSPPLIFSPSLVLGKGFVRQKFVKERVIALTSRTLCRTWCIRSNLSFVATFFSTPLCFLSLILNVCYGPSALYGVTKPSS